MDEQVISKLFEYSLVGGAFVYLLVFVTKKISAALDVMGENLQKFGASLENVSNTLMRFDTRFELLEKRLDEIERR